MANYPPPYPPPPGPPGPPYGVDPRYQRQILRDQARAQRDAMKVQREMYRAQVRGMRRTSVVGPILVVALGVLFLLVQLGKLPGYRLWDWYARWWPLLLIAIGVIRLGEWALDQRTASGAVAGAPRSRRVMGGGIVFLLGLLGATGLLMSTLHDRADEFFGNGFSFNQDNLDEFLGDKHESDQELTHTCPASCALTINNPRGDVSVSGTSDDGQVHISAHKEVYSRSDSDANSKAQQLTTSVEQSESGLVVNVPSIEGGRADLTLTVPETAVLTVTANRGDVRISSLKAPLVVTANHGDVDLSAIHGPISAHINNGDSSFSSHSVTGPVAIEGRGHDLTLTEMSGPLSISGEFFGTTHLERIRGPIRFHTSRTDLQLGRLDGETEISANADLTGDRIAGPVMLNTRNRNITLERVTGDIAVTNRNGSVDLTVAQPNGTVTIENRSGSVNVTMPNDAGFQVQADTNNGDLENDFSLPSGGGEGHPSLSGTVNKGGPLVRISTSEGDVSLKKGSIAPLPPLPPVPPLSEKLTALPPGALNGVKQSAEEAQDAAREAAAQLRDAQEKIRSANRDAGEAQRDAQRRAAEAQRDAQRAVAEAQREAQRNAAEAQRAAAEAQREAQRKAAEAQREAARQAKDPQ